MKLVLSFMPNLSKPTLTFLTGIALVSAILITIKAYNSDSTLEQSSKLGPTAKLQPPTPAAAPDTQPADELTEEEIDRDLVPLLLDETEDDKEALISFSNDDELSNFIANLHSLGLTLLSSNATLKTARVSFSDLSQLEAIKGAEISPNYSVSIPSPPDATAQANATGFGNTALQSIGITSDNSAWGKGVTVAVIDSGVNDHIALQGEVRQVALTDLNGQDQLSHGTAVASIISGDISRTPGVAPASDILSIRVTNSNGSSDSYTLAEGIITAADQGAQIINISMGASSGSVALQRAVTYAQDKGAILVASSGNEGATEISYPAAYSGVLSVGAIEATGEHLDFSNQGSDLTLTAPGFEVNAAWGTDLLTGFSGTSASAPFVSGALAAILSERPNLTSDQAVSLLLENTNEAGTLGNDPFYGTGTLDLGRALESGTPGIYDAAVTSHVFQTDEAGNDSLLVVVQNQGTETIFNSPVTINTPFGTSQVSINSLSPGETFSKSIPFNHANIQSDYSISSEISINSALDVDPSNNIKTNNFQIDAAN